LERENWIYPGVDTERANVARVYDALLGGTHNFTVDRDAANTLTAIEPGTRDAARANRAFLGRAVRFLADSGIRQFLDIGSGVPTEGNVHEVARAAAPESRVVYVDTDPVATAHSKAILTGDDKATVIEADLREPEAILDHPEVARLIDFAQPVGLLLVAVLHFIEDEEHPNDLVKRLARRLAPGSYLAISHGTTDSQSTAAIDAGRRLYTRATAPIRLRGHAEIRTFFDGFDLVEPGVVFIPRWRPDGPGPFTDHPERSWMYAGVARKP
jgi:SAM-dependent methyltransferase